MIWRTISNPFTRFSRKKKVVSELKAAAQRAETVWLASDEDREGEAISWHLYDVLDLKNKDTKRIVFHEITKPAIQEAVKNPREINRNLVDAQQARRVLDRIVGFELSPVLWRKIKPALSAGRYSRSPYVLLSSGNGRSRISNLRLPIGW